MQTREAVLEAFLGANRILLTTHLSPDADAIGSVFGLALGLKSLGKAAEIYLVDGSPQKFVPLLPSDMLVHEYLPTSDFDLVLSVDTATKRRVGPQHLEYFELAPVTMHIDHHVSNERYAQINYIRPTASTAEIVLELLSALGVAFDRVIANLLFAGLMDDTGSFRFQNADEHAFSSAAKLIHHGAQPNYVADALYFRVPIGVLRLRALALSELHVVADGKAGLITIPRAMMESAGVVPGDTEGVVDEVRSLEGILVALCVRETDSGWKVSFRSKIPELDVNELASQFGGGGHRVAAGCTIVGSRDEVEAKLISAVQASLSRLS